MSLIEDVFSYIKLCILIPLLIMIGMIFGTDLSWLTIFITGPAIGIFLFIIGILESNW
ncbi:MAG: hypothetical protein KJ906_03460 [Nanoarchaeota archaeon]|nr:hypothetical protein [Nanoarchaeota archaeon]